MHFQEIFGIDQYLRLLDEHDGLTVMPGVVALKEVDQEQMCLKVTPRYLFLYFSTAIW